MAVLCCCSALSFTIIFKQAMAIARSSSVLTQLLHVSHLPKLCMRVTTHSAPTHRTRIGFGLRIRCAASESEGQKKVSARLSKMHEILNDAEERASSAGSEPIPKVTIDHVTVSFARSGGAGGQNVNKVNTKVDMRFNVKQAYWLSERVRERILQIEKNRINKEGEIVISSTKFRTQKDNIQDALEKLQAIIAAASYVPPPPSEEQKKRIGKLAAIGEQKRLQNKKSLSQKKEIRRTRDSWD